MTALRNFIVGLVFLGSLVAVRFVTTQGSDLGWTGRTEYTIPFDQVNGLKPGGEVRIFGYRVGQVESIKLQPKDEPRPISVTIRINKDLTLNADSRFEIKSAGPLGGNYLEITPLKANVKRLLAEILAVPLWQVSRDGTVDLLEALDRNHPDTLEREVRARMERALTENDPPGRLRAFLDDRQSWLDREALQVSAAMRGKANPELFDELSGLVRENREAIREAIGALRGVLKAVENKEGILGALISDADLKNQVVATVKSIEAITGSIRRGEGSLGKIIMEPELYNDLRDTIQSAKTIAKEIEEGKGTIGKLVKDPRLYDDLQETMASAKVIAKNLQDGKGAVGRLLADEELADRVESLLKNAEEAIAKVNQGEGTLGQVINNREAWDRLVFVLRQVQEAVEDFREQAPINTFVNAIFAAF